MRKRLALCVCFLFALFALSSSAWADADYNRFNVAIVLDASGSMKWTDKDDLRYQAIRIFLQMLTEQGNMVGGVVFSEGIDASIQPILIQSQADKDRVYDALKAVPAIGQWTNIGLGLDVAVDSLIQYGNPDNPSVVLLLSDGNTDMPDSKAVRDSVERQSNAIQKAREKDVHIYGICLNTDGSADADEMLRISGSRERFQNLSSPNDLSDAFSVFYDMIYDTFTMQLINGEIPSSGELEKSFQVPGVGVEEVNIIIYGNFTSLSVTRPDGTPCPAQPRRDGSITTLKITDLQQGTWNLRVGGTTGDKVKVNMKYNTDMVLTTDVSVGQAADADTGSREITVYATIGSPGSPGTEEEYEGFTAEAIVSDAEKELKRYTMNQDGDRFSVSIPLSEGIYYLQVRVEGYDMVKTSPPQGPYNITPPEEIPPENHPPVPVETPVTERVWVLPVGTTHDIDMNVLAEDPDGDALTYRVENSSLLPGTDYTEKDGVLTITQFPLHRSVFTIQARDTGGLTCDIEVIVVSCHVALVALLGIVALILLGLLIFGLWVWRCLGVEFMGSIEAGSLNEWGADVQQKNRGRIRLSAFGLSDTGLSGRCYFQASGRDYVTFISPWPHGRFYTDISDRPVRRIRISSEIPVEIYSDRNHEKGMRASFSSTAGSGFGDYPGGGMDDMDSAFYKNSSI